MPLAAGEYTTRVNFVAPAANRDFPGFSFQVPISLSSVWPNARLATKRANTARLVRVFIPRILFLRFRKVLLRDLRHDAGVAVGDLGDLVLDGDAEEHRGFGPGQPVIGFEPGQKRRRRLLERVVERAGEAHRHDVVGVLDPRALDRFGANEIHRELDVHRSLERVAVELAVALDRMSVADVKERAGLADREIDGGPFD